VRLRRKRISREAHEAMRMKKSDMMPCSARKMGGARA
jgi:hypothetical protein